MAEVAHLPRGEWVMASTGSPKQGSGLRERSKERTRQENMEDILILRNHTINVPTPSSLHSSFRPTWPPAVHHVSKSAREVYGYKYHNNPLKIRGTGTRPIHLPQDRVMAPVYDAAELRSDFIQLLRSRRSEEGTRVRSPFSIFLSLFLVRSRNVRSQTLGKP